MLGILIQEIKVMVQRDRFGSAGPRSWKSSGCALYRCDGEKERVW